MKQRILFLIMLCFALCVQAQELTVKTMEAAGSDISASTQRRTDLNGNPCALVKVQLATPGAKFEGNVIGDTEFKTGEYWVYMTDGSYMLQVKHPSFLPLMVNFRDYEIRGVKPLNTYVLKIAMPQVLAGPVDDGQRYLAMTVEPEQGAVVLIDGELQELTNGSLSLLLPMGQHSYSVACKGYQTQSGTVNLVDNRTTLPIKLESTMGRLSISCATTTASLFVNDQLKGTGQWSGQLAAGSYRVEARQDGYRPQRQSIVLAERGNESVAIPALQPIVGNLNVNYQPLDAEVWLDGKKLGVSPNIFRNIMVGSHKVEINAVGYEKAEQTVVIEENQTASLQGALRKGQVSKVQVSERVKQNPHFIKRGDLYGYIDYLGREVIPCQYKNAWNFEDGMAMVMNADSLYGFIDNTGKDVIPCQWKDAYSFHEGLAAVKDSNGKWGYIDRSGRIVISCQWRSTGGFSDGLAYVENNNYQYGYIDKSGRVVIPCQYSVSDSFSEGMACVSYYEGSVHKAKYIDKKGNTVFHANGWDFGGKFSDGVTIVDKSNKDTNNWQVKFSLLDNKGKLIIPNTWWTVIHATQPFSEGMHEVQGDNGKWGFINKKGKVVIDYQWASVWGFEEGMAQVEDANGKWGYINNKGKNVIPCQWEYAASFKDGTAWVKISDDNWRLIDKNGKYIE